MSGTRRTDLLTVAIAGDFGKPRPALVVQSDQFSEQATVSVLLLSGTVLDAPLFRITVHPDGTNGLQKISQIMVDKVLAVKRNRLGSVVASVSEQVIMEVSRCLAVFLGIAK